MIFVLIGFLTTKSDVYSFGVVLLELLTGRQAIDKKRAPREQNLVEWAKSFLRDSHKLDRIMDPRLEGEYSTQGAKKVASLAYQCLSHQPKSRPTMSNVVKILEPILDLKDIPIGPFVYVVPSFDSRSGVKTKENEEKENKENKMHIISEQNDKGSARVKDQLKSATHVHSDTHLYKTLRQEFR